MTRRSALMALGAAPLFAPAAALGLSGRTPPSDRIALGFVGAGARGRNNLRSFLGEPDVRVAAVCDVDARHLGLARAELESSDCSSTPEMQEIFAREDIDAVVLSLPDHWHGIASVGALRAGKDVYGEKPLSHNWSEARQFADAVRRYGRVWLTGSWQRSHASFRFACEIVRNGRTGIPAQRALGVAGDKRP